jgi:hypothetical protein
MHSSQFHNSSFWHELSVHTAKQHLQIINYIQWKSKSSLTITIIHHILTLFSSRCSLLKGNHIVKVIQKRHRYAHEVGLLADAQNLPENIQLRSHVLNSTKIHEVVCEMKRGRTDGLMFVLQFSTVYVHSTSKQTTKVIDLFQYQALNVK